MTWWNGYIITYFMREQVLHTATMPKSTSALLPGALWTDGIPDEPLTVVTVRPDKSFGIRSTEPGLAGLADRNSSVLILACDWSASMRSFYDDQMQMMLSFIRTVQGAGIGVGRAFLIIYASSVHRTVDAADPNAEAQVRLCPHPDCGTSFSGPLMEIARIARLSPEHPTRVFFSTDGESNWFGVALAGLKATLKHPDSCIVPVYFGARSSMCPEFLALAHRAKPVVIEDVDAFTQTMADSVRKLGHSVAASVITPVAEHAVALFSNGETAIGHGLGLVIAEDASVRIQVEGVGIFEALVARAPVLPQIPPAETPCTIASLMFTVDVAGIVQNESGAVRRAQHVLKSLNEMRKSCVEQPLLGAIGRAADAVTSALMHAAANSARDAGHSRMLRDAVQDLKELAQWMATASHGSGGKAARAVKNAASSVTRLVLQHREAVREAQDELRALLPKVVGEHEGLPPCPITLETTEKHGAFVVLTCPGSEFKVDDVLAAIDEADANGAGASDRVLQIMAPANNPGCARVYAQGDGVVGAPAYLEMLKTPRQTLVRASMVAVLVQPLRRQSPEQTKFLRLSADLIAMQMVTGVTTNGRSSTVQAFAAAAWSLWTAGHAGAAVAMVPYYVAGMRRRSAWSNLCEQLRCNAFAITHSNAADRLLPNVHATATAMLAEAIHTDVVCQPRVLVFELARARVAQLFRDGTLSTAIAADLPSLIQVDCHERGTDPAALLRSFRHAVLERPDDAMGVYRTFGAQLREAVRAIRSVQPIDKSHPAAVAAYSQLRAWTSGPLPNPSTYVLPGTPTLDEVMRFLAFIPTIVASVDEIDANGGWYTGGSGSQAMSLEEAIDAEEAVALVLLLSQCRGNPRSIRELGPCARLKLLDVYRRRRRRPTPRSAAARVVHRDARSSRTRRGGAARPGAFGGSRDALAGPARRGHAPAVRRRDRPGGAAPGRLAAARAALGRGNEGGVQDVQRAARCRGGRAVGAARLRERALRSAFRRVLPVGAGLGRGARPLCAQQWHGQRQIHRAAA